MRLLNSAYIKSIVVLIIMTMLFSCKNDPELVRGITIADTLPQQSAKDIEVVLSDSGIVQIKLLSPRMLYFITEDPYYEFPDGIEVLFYDTALNVKSRLRANYAINWLKKNIMEARHNVVINDYEKNETIKTERLVWEQNKKRVFSDAFVERATPFDTLYGDGFDADETFSRYVLRNPRGTFSVEDDD